MTISGKKFNFLIRLLFLGFTILILMKIVDFKLVISSLSNVPLIVVCLILLMNIFRLWLTGLRWRLLNPDKTEQLSSWHYFRFVMIAHTFNLVMPGALGGDFVRTAYTLKTVKHHRIDNVIAILVDRFIGLLSILVLGTVSFYFMSTVPDRSAFNTFWGFLYGVVLLFIVLILNTRFHNFLVSCFSRMGKVGLWLDKVLHIWQDSIKYFLMNKGRVVLALLLCLPIHMISFFTAYFLARNIGIAISFFDISLIISMVWIITAVPITISGVGVRELSMIYFMSLYGIDHASAAALSIFIYFVIILLGLLGLFFIIDFSKLSGKEM